jgi:hypothetical protein
MGEHESLRKIAVKLEKSQGDSVFYESYVKRSFGRLEEDRLNLGAIDAALRIEGVMR